HARCPLPRMLSAALLFQRFQGCERPRTIIAGFNRGKFSARLARIGINSEQQKFRCDRTEIDLAPDQRLARVFVASLVVCAVILCSGIEGRREKKVDGLIEIAFERLERHHTGPPDPSLYLAGHMHPAASAREIKDRREVRQIAQIRELNQMRAHLGWRLHFNVESGFRDIVHGNGHTPGVLGVFHQYQSFAPEASSSTRTVAAGSGIVSRPARTCEAGCTLNSPTVPRIYAARRRAGAALR